MTKEQQAVRDRNVAAVEAMYESERVRDLTAWTSLWHPEGRQTFPFAQAATVEGIEQLTETTRHKFESRPPYAIHVVTEPFEDPARVLARLRLETPQGQLLAVIWCVFHLDKAGLIVEVEEMLDTASATPIPG
ncbi:nuclear transport factor 2 family protein [Microlunatus antarcticus]|uniref:SnoaL-like domain-containing protein n=1 Tax=Microlunatus antarcticus TaxID=53388 RepID=A0A7W5JU87_9ACTN|nr:nuclear transport factor 2 family protein [Microlunatus antarcticus]MBB3326442.1 hypothetical protein [Microlunatus antarcticus]